MLHLAWNDLVSSVSKTVCTVHSSLLSSTVRLYAVPFALSLALLASTGSLRAADILVPSEQTTIQAGILAASDGDAVVVAPGHYTETIDFGGEAITVRSAAGAAATTIDGGGFPDTNVVSFLSGEGPDSVLEGFTISGGTGTITGDFFATTGGGVLAIGASPTLRECRFTLNDCLYGAGVALYEVPGAALIQSCEFVDNIGHDGVGIFATGPGSITVLDCQFTQNDAFIIGGGAALACAEVLVEDCLFQNNNADLALAGGLALGNPFNLGTLGFFDATIRRTEFRNNDSSFGGGVYAYQVFALFEECLFVGNTGDVAAVGQDLADIVLSRCLVVGNNSDTEILGPSINPGTLTIDRTTIANNNCSTVIQLPGAGAIALSNSIVHGNSGPAWTNPSVSATYSNVTGGWPGVGNIDADPLFVDAANGNYHLLPGSPCIDSGDPGATLDPDGTTIEMGALPFGEALFVRGDANQDARVDLGDGIWILNEIFLGGAASICQDASDANDDGVVDLGDATTIFGHVLLDAGPLPAPGSSCGEDTTDDTLECPGAVCP